MSFRTSWSASPINGRLRAFRSADSGAVSIIGAFSLVGMIGAIALSVELGQGYVAFQSNQRTADMAALGGAGAYVAQRDQKVLLATANDIANANGARTSQVTARFIANYENSGVDVIRVDVRSTIPLYFARVLKSDASYEVTSTGVASLPSASAPACIIALNGNVSVSGGAAITAKDCAVTSNKSTSVVGGSRITAKGLSTTDNLKVEGGSHVTATDVLYGGSTSTQAGSSITGSQSRRSVTVADPLDGNAKLASAFNALGAHTTPAKPSVPTGEDLTLGYYPTTMTFQGRTSTLANGVWTFPPGTYAIRNLNTQSLTLNIQGPSVVTVSGSVNVGGGGKLIIGDGPVSIAAPVNLSGGTSMQIGAGRHYLGRITLGGGSNITLGAGNLDVDGPINISGGGSRMTVGAGDVAVGAANGKGIELSGGGELRFGHGRFSSAGSIVTQGGSTLAIGDTATHYINGDLDLRGTVILGRGLYLINGAFSNTTGGSITGTDVTFILRDQLTYAGGAGINLAAPGENSTWGIPGILFASMTSKAVSFGGGAQGKYSGALYFPKSDFTLSGGAGMSSSCFTLIAKSVTVTSGPTATSTCPGLDGATTNSGNATLIR
jgi:hypothetical protein